MSRRPQTTLNGSQIPKMPSRREVEAMAKQRAKEEKELVEKMNIPPRDEAKYPMPDREDVVKAASFIYTLGALAESYDGNLKALVWDLYVRLMECMERTSGQEELFAMIGTLTNLKGYLATCHNPLFSKEPQKEPQKEG